MSAPPSGHSLVLDVLMLSPLTAAELARTGGLAFAAGTGTLVFTTHFLAYGELIPMPSVKVAVGSSPSLYVAADGVADPSLETSSEAAWGIAFGLPQGTTSVSATAKEYDGIACGILNADTGTIDSSFDVDVVEGYTTFVSILCASAT